MGPIKSATIGLNSKSIWILNKTRTRTVYFPVKGNFPIEEIWSFQENIVVYFSKIRYFLNRKCAFIRKTAVRLTEADMLEKLEARLDRFGPLIITRIERETTLKRGLRVDALLKFSIPNGPSFEAVAELSPVSSPKMILDKSRILRNVLYESPNRKVIPLIVAPYIGKKQSELLLEEGVSWIDLSGNMLIRVPPNIYIERSGKPNRYPDSAPIKKVFQGTSSLVSRALLLNPRGFSSLYEIVNFINDRNGNITLATVSKVLKSLEEDLLITKERSLISVKRPEELLGQLAEGYSDYKRRRRDRQFRYDVENVGELCRMFYEDQVDYAYCGFYAAKIKGLAVTDQVSMFIKSSEQARKAFRLDSSNISRDEEFGQLCLIETKNPCVWFNLQREPFENVVDDLELYLEMMIDTPRGPKIAGVLKDRILGVFYG